MRMLLILFLLCPRLSPLDAEPNFTPMFVHAEHGLFLRSGPGLQYASVTLIQNEALVLVENGTSPTTAIGGVRGQWRKTHFRKLNGFAFSGYLRSPTSSEQKLVDLFLSQGTAIALIDSKRKFNVNLKLTTGQIGQYARYGDQTECYYGAGQGGCGIDGVESQSNGDLHIFASHQACSEWGPSELGIGPCLAVHSGKYKCDLSAYDALQVVLGLQRSVDASCVVLKEDFRTCKTNCWTE
ncbi:MAG: hypothetical protein JNM27_18460 [Leptospirales bacterium]|nr:hypothetical protein [Leptospirales bacterium]